MIIAVKFNAQRTKKKFYVKWRETLPLVQKVKRAKGKYDSTVLCTFNVLFTLSMMRYTSTSTARFFNHWLEAYRTKLVSKAIALVFS